MLSTRPHDESIHPQTATKWLTQHPRKQKQDYRFNCWIHNSCKMLVDQLSILTKLIQEPLRELKMTARWAHKVGKRKARGVDCTHLSWLLRCTTHCGGVCVQHSKNDVQSHFGPNLAPERAVPVPTTTTILQKSLESYIPMTPLTHKYS